MKIEAIKRRLAKAVPGVAIGPVEVDLGHIRADPTLQVRSRLDEGNLADLKAAYKSGAKVEPVTLALIDGDDDMLVIIDGHHRVTVLETLDAEARVRGGERVRVVNARVARLSFEEARFQAADANSRHGLKLDRDAKRRLFVRYIEAGRHQGAAGSAKSYRDIGKELGTTHNSISTWMKANFPALAAKMGDVKMVKSGGTGAPTPVALVKHKAHAKLMEVSGLFEGGLSGDREEIIAGMKSLLVDMERAHARTNSFTRDDAIAGMGDAPDTDQPVF